MGASKALAASRAQAQAQAQQQAEITSTESLELVRHIHRIEAERLPSWYISLLCCWGLQVRCLLRVSVFHTAWLRGIFPDSYFKSVQAAGLDGEAPRCYNNSWYSLLLDDLSDTAHNIA